MADRSKSGPRLVGLGLNRELLTNIPVVALVAANLLPIYGVLFLGWEAFNIVLLYWAENIVIGFYNILKMATAKAEHPIAYAARIFPIAFFTIHFGGFCAVHGIFVFILFQKGQAGSIFPVAGQTWPCFLVFVQLLIGVITHCWTTITPHMRYVLVALFASHGVSFVQNYLIKGEYKSAKGDKLMNAPYGRVVVMHVAIIFGGFVSMTIGSPAGVLVVLVVIKTIVDIKFHLRQHRKIPQAKP